MNDKDQQPLALIVDDDVTMRLLLRQALEQHQFRVVDFDNGRRAIADLPAKSQPKPAA